MKKTGEKQQFNTDSNLDESLTIAKTLATWSLERGMEHF